MDAGVLGAWGTEGGPRRIPALGAGQDAHEVMAISTSRRERGIQRPKQQNTDTTCLERSKKLKAGREATCPLEAKPKHLRCHDLKVAS